jgi:hypothetical protein
MAGVSAAPSFSPDGYLFTATALGNGVQTIDQSDASYAFYCYQWAADGKRIDYVEGAELESLSRVGGLHHRYVWKAAA